MKNILYTFLGIACMTILFSCENNKNAFTVNVALEGIDDEMLIMQQRSEGEWVTLDSAMLVDGKATFTGSLDQPEFFYFNIKDTRQYIPLFVEAGTINVNASVETLRRPAVTGSKTQTKYDELLSSLDKFDELTGVLSQQYQQAQQAGDEEMVDQIVQQFDDLEAEKSEAILSFAIANNTSVVSPFVVMNYSYMFEVEDLESVADVLDPSLATSVYTESLNNRINTLNSVAVGQPFVDFTLNDPDGNPIALSSIANGKYVLVDFWASWCGPCRAENPNVVEAYNRFHDSGFEVFGVSFDNDHDKWVEAIEKDGLVWNHVSDLKYWASEAGKLYGVQSIPHSVLIGPDGIIINKNLRGEELQETLMDLLGPNKDKI